MKSLPALMIALATMTSSTFSAETVHEFKMKSLKGEEVDLERYKGKVLLIVNTASECGLTPQYEQLQAMHKEYKDKGLVILGFPCNQFGQQEPGTAAEISNFCQENYGVEFSMFSKIDVNGEKQAPLYEYLKAEAPLKENGKKVSAEKNVIRWNFEKFVVDKNGKVAERFSPGTKPDSDEVLEVIRQELAE